MWALCWVPSSRLTRTSSWDQYDRAGSEAPHFNQGTIRCSQRPQENAIYVALPELVALFLSPTLIPRGCSVFLTTLRHFPPASPSTASRGYGTLPIGSLYTRGLLCELPNHPSRPPFPSWCARGGNVIVAPFLMSIPLYVTYLHLS
jgi:hypothetical protein